MEIIIADDFTGASDSGIKFKERNLETKVVWDLEIRKYLDKGNLISLDLDTRNISEEEAYQRTEYIFKQLHMVNSRKIFKKIDSTMRGNITAEINAMLDSKEIDFTVVIPSYPDNNRYLKGGKLYVNDVLLEDTPFYKDVLLPFKSSLATEIISFQSKYKVKRLNKEDISYNFEENICSSLKDNVKIFVCDAETNQDIQEIYDNFSTLNNEFIWSGSAGLANIIAKSLKSKEFDSISQYEPENGIIVALGSTNEVTRKQLQALVLQTDINSIEISAYKLLHSEKLQSEILEIALEIFEYLSEGENVVIYTNASDAEQQKLNDYKLKKNINNRQIGKKISKGLGMIIDEVNRKFKIKNLIMSGGDTAKGIADTINYKEYELFHSIEEGMPLGILQSDNSQIISVTKSGGFGTEDSLVKAYITLGGHFKNGYQRNNTSDGYSNQRQ